MKLLKGLLVGVLPALAVAGLVYGQTLQGGWLGPAGTNGQVQINNGGQLGGITIGGDATLNSTTGALTVTTLAGLTPATIPSAPTTGDCVKWLSATTLGDAGAACGGSGSTPGGSSGDIQFNNAGAFGGSAATITAAGIFTDPLNGAANASVFNLTGTIFSGTTSTASPYFYYNCSGATAPSFTATGSFLGINACTGFAGDILDVWINGGSKGSISAAGVSSFLTQSFTQAFTRSGTVIMSATAPSAVNASCGSTSVFANTNGTVSFELTIGGTGITSTCSWAMPAGTHKWHCWGDDLTTTTEVLHQTAAASTTSVGVTFYAITTGTATAPTSGDDILISCLGN